MDHTLYAWGNASLAGRGTVRYNWESLKNPAETSADMVRIEVDVETAKKIEDASEPIELYASDGRQIGYFSHPIPSDEIAEARRLASLPSSGRSLDEVWDRIRSRGEVE